MAEQEDSKSPRKKRLRSAARWLLPLLLTAPLALLLSPGLVRGPSNETEPAAKSTTRAPVVEDVPTALTSPDLDVPAAIAPGAAELDATAPRLADEWVEPLPESAATEEEADSTLDCIIEPSVKVEIGSPVLGLIENIHVERGDLVEAGQALVELESSVEKAAVEVARARAGMDGSIRSRQTSLELGKRRQQRASTLFNESALSADLREQAETEAELARLELQQARENQRLASLQLQQALQVLNRRTIRSPISGVVVDRRMSPGEVVDEDEKVLTLAQIDPLHVEVVLPSAMFGSVEPGSQAAVVPEFPGDQVHVATVKIVDRVIDAASGTFGVRLELPNPNGAIPGGLHCQVRFETE